METSSSDFVVPAISVSKFEMCNFNNYKCVRLGSYAFDILVSGFYFYVLTKYSAYWAFNVGG